MLRVGGDRKGADVDGRAFRKLALALPLASEGEHMGHPDFRVAGKIFASLPPPRRKSASKAAEGARGAGELGMVSLTPEQQAAMVRDHPGVFEPAAGAWGRRGYTYVTLARAGERLVKRALRMAWEKTVPQRAVEQLGGGSKPPKLKRAGAAAPERTRGTGGRGGKGAVRVGLKRVYEGRGRTDGTRILVERLWPRGLTKERAGVDVWMKEVSPSPALRKWYGHDPAKWEEFQRRYRKELAANADAVEELRRLAKEGPVTLVYAASDEVRNSAAVLREVLEERASGRSTRSRA